MPRPLSTVAAISPATKVPCPVVSFAVPPTKLREATTCERSSGCESVDARVDHAYANLR